jgi:hypothetical protein
MSRSMLEAGWAADWIPVWMDDNVVNLFIYTILPSRGYGGEGVLD